MPLRAFTQPVRDAVRQVRELTTAEAPWRVMYLPPELTTENRQQWKLELLDCIHAGDAHLIVDAIDCRYIDSSGLGVLVSLAKAARREGGQLKIRGLNEDLRTLFELTRLDTVLEVVP